MTIITTKTTITTITIKKNFNDETLVKPLQSGASHL